MSEVSRDLETWLPVVGYEGLYQVSDHGRVLSEGRVVRRRDMTTALLKPRVLQGRADDQGYIIVGMSKPGSPSRQKRVHRLVLEAFVGPCPDGMECCHGPGGPGDNRLENLRWDTRFQNAQDQVRHGTHFRKNLTHCPYGHKLAQPNLVAALARQGKRKCWSCVTACRRAVEALKFGGIVIDKRTEADRLYELRMAGAKPYRESFKKSIMSETCPLTLDLDSI